MDTLLAEPQTVSSLTFDPHQINYLREDARCSFAAASGWDLFPYITISALEGVFIDFYTEEQLKNVSFKVTEAQKQQRIRLKSNCSDRIFIFQFILICVQI